MKNRVSARAPCRGALTLTPATHWVPEITLENLWRGGSRKCDSAIFGLKLKKKKNQKENEKPFSLYLSSNMIKPTGLDLWLICGRAQAALVWPCPLLDPMQTPEPG